MDSSHQDPAARSVSVRAWDLDDPAVKEALDLGRAEAVADGLQPLGVVAAGEAVGQLGDGQTGLGRLPLGPLVPLPQTLAGYGK
jgi:hypothetical protein